MNPDRDHNDKSGVRKEGVSFHRTFSLRREILRQILAIAFDGNSLEYAALRSSTTLGTVQVESARNYGVACGLLDQAWKITGFGKRLFERDPSLALPQTQWMMHYFISAPHGCGPTFWNFLALNHLRPGNRLSSAILARQLDEFVREKDQRSIALGTLQSAATVFLGSYAKADGLDALCVLQPEGSKEYVVREPAIPGPWVFACALADYWDAMWGNLKTVNLNGVTGEGGPAALLFLGTGAANQLLRRVQELGVVQVHRSAPPYQVVRLWERAGDLLERLYDDDGEG